MTEPQPLSAGFAQLAATTEAGTRIGDTARLAAKADRTCALRRAGVLRHPDLARRITELGYATASQWNGWIPPRLLAYDDGELLRDVTGFLNMRGKRTIGQQVNDSERRAIVLDISAEAWRREHRPASSYAMRDYSPC